MASNTQRIYVSQSPSTRRSSPLSGTIDDMDLSQDHLDESRGVSSVSLSNLPLRVTERSSSNASSQPPTGERTAMHYGYTGEVGANVEGAHGMFDEHHGHGFQSSDAALGGVIPPTDSTAMYTGSAQQLSHVHSSSSSQSRSSRRRSNRQSRRRSNGDRAPSAGAMGRDSANEVPKTCVEVGGNISYQTACCPCASCWYFLDGFCHGFLSHCCEDAHRRRPQRPVGESRMIQCWDPWGHDVDHDLCRRCLHMVFGKSVRESHEETPAPSEPVELEPMGASAESETVAPGEQQPKIEISGDDVDTFACKVCYENRINTVLLWCGHEVVCLDCAQRQESCPICRQAIGKIVVTYDN